jgi:3-hydroxyacyl-[acyl-carrier-protein] dehydratase
VDIQQLIPHRPPFLFVDEIVAIDGQTIRARKKIDGSAEFFKGHFPDHPVMPGVLICEALAQAGALLIAQLENADLRGKIPALTRMNNVKFKQMVRPGDTLDLEVRLKEKLANAYFLEGAARVGGKLAVSLEFACALVEKRAEPRP